MAQCYNRKRAWLTDKGLSFSRIEGARCVSVPCGKCLPCRVNNACSWAIRSYHEMIYSGGIGVFLTLTYDDNHLPKGSELVKKHLQNFNKRLRINLKRDNIPSFRSFFACGEYGTKKGRPHYHELLFGYVPDDLVFYKTSYSGQPLYISDKLNRIWGNGFVFVGLIGDGAAGYVARYQKKSKADTSHTQAPFFLSSRNIPLSNGERGALGSQWLLDHYNDIRHGYIHHWSKPGIKLRIPEYYYDLLDRWYPDTYQMVKDSRLNFCQGLNDDLIFFRRQGCFDVCHSDPRVSYPDYMSQVRDILKLSPETSFPEVMRYLRAHLAYSEKAQFNQLTKLKRTLNENE